MKLYTTSQAIRILERNSDKDYLFEAPKTHYHRKNRLWKGQIGGYVCEVAGTDDWYPEDNLPDRLDWRLVRPKRKQGRSIALSGEAIGVVSWKSKHADHYRSLPPGTWTLIAVEKTGD